MADRFLDPHRIGVGGLLVIGNFLLVQRWLGAGFVYEAAGAVTWAVGLPVWRPVAAGLAPSRAKAWPARRRGGHDCDSQFPGPDRSGRAREPPLGIAEQWPVPRGRAGSL